MCAMVCLCEFPKRERESVCVFACELMYIWDICAAIVLFFSFLYNCSHINSICARECARARQRPCPHSPHIYQNETHATANREFKQRTSQTNEFITTTTIRQCHLFFTLSHSIAVDTRFSLCRSDKPQWMNFWFSPVYCSILPFLWLKCDIFSAWRIFCA